MTAFTPSPWPHWSRRKPNAQSPPSVTETSTALGPKGLRTSVSAQRSAPRAPSPRRTFKTFANNLSPTSAAPTTVMGDPLDPQMAKILHQTRDTPATAAPRLPTLAERLGNLASTVADLAANLRPKVSQRQAGFAPTCATSSGSTAFGRLSTTTTPAAHCPPDQRPLAGYPPRRRRPCTVARINGLWPIIHHPDASPAASSGSTAFGPPSTRTAVTHACRNDLVSNRPRRPCDRMAIARLPRPVPPLPLPGLAAR